VITQTRPDDSLERRVSTVGQALPGETAAAARISIPVRWRNFSAACRGKISRYKIPRHVFFVESYPLTASGKIQKYKQSVQAARLIGSANPGSV
jgi:acyl-CoA synthetase (AMP-forming)/AMP-acid ligase II